MPAGTFFPSGFSETMASVVSRSAAMLAAFCNAERVTFVGSTTPAFSMSSYWSVAALNPIGSFSALSRSIQRLEAEVGCPLFERDNRSVALTDLNRFKEALAVVDRALELDPQYKPAVTALLSSSR